MLKDSLDTSQCAANEQHIRHRANCAPADEQNRNTQIASSMSEPASEANEKISTAHTAPSAWLDDEQSVMQPPWFWDATQTLPVFDANHVWMAEDHNIGDSALFDPVVIRDPSVNSDEPRIVHEEET